MRTLTVTALALLVLLAGCGGADQSGPTTTDAATPTTDDGAPALPTTDTESPATTPTPTGTAPPTTEAWTPPEEPATPVENATGPNRITRVRFYGTENGSGFSEFDVAAYANTTTAAVGGAEDGSVYYFVWVEGEPIARTEVVSWRNETLTTVSVPEAGLEQFEPGDLAVRVELLRSGEDGTVRHGRWNGTVTYRPAGNQSG